MWEFKSDNRIEKHNSEPVYSHSLLSEDWALAVKILSSLTRYTRIFQQPGEIRAEEPTR